ncbi:MAG: hypothetical protein IJT05_09765, partial [Lachnospiraceae bacterium]|nr:hypothetical protein [Lachnospiraceae bacterium]
MKKPNIVLEFKSNFSILEINGQFNIVQNLEKNGIWEVFQMKEKKQGKLSFRVVLLLSALIPLAA